MSPDTYNNFNSIKFNKDFEFNSLFAAQKLAKENEEDLKEISLPESTVLPTGEEIRNMKSWEFQYKTKNPKASDREVRRAVIREFNIVVINGQNYIKK